MLLQQIFYGENGIRAALEMTVKPKRSFFHSTE